MTPEWAFCVRVIGSGESLLFPDDPMLAAWAWALNEAGHWAHVLDAEWRYVFETDEMRSSFADMAAGSPEPLPVGSHFFSAESMHRVAVSVRGPWAVREHRRQWFLEVGPYVLANTPGGRDGLRRVVDPDLADLVDELEPRDLPAVWVNRPEWSTAGADVTGTSVYIRVDGKDGELANLRGSDCCGRDWRDGGTGVGGLAGTGRQAVCARPERQPAAGLQGGCLRQPLTVVLHAHSA